MSNKNNIIDFFKHIQDNYPEFSPVKGRPYGNASFNPRTKLSIVVKKSCVEVGFRTDGKKNDFSKDNFMKWANNSGILRTKCPNDDYFYLRGGVKNKNKVMVYTEVGYDNATDLNDVEFRLILTDIYKFLLEFVKKDFIPNIKKTANAEPNPSETVVEETVMGTINEDVVNQWRLGGSRQEFNVETMTEYVYSDNIKQMLSSIRMVTSYIIDKYEAVHEDHERDCTAGIEGFSFFSGKFSQIAADLSGGDPSDYTNDYEELIENGFITQDDLLLGPQLSEEETKQLVYAYLCLMRGEDDICDEDIEEACFSKNIWIGEMELTFQFLMEE